METNGAGQHVDYLEIYLPDVLAPELQPELKEASALFPR
jgi:hypothetical protein